MKKTEPLLLAGHQGLKEHAATIPESVREQRLTEAFESLNQLDDAWGKTDQAAEWRKKLEAEKKPAARQKESPDDAHQGEWPVSLCLRDPLRQ